MKTKKTALRTIIFLLCTAIAIGSVSVSFSALAESIAAPGNTRPNLAPVAKNLEFTTFRDIALIERFAASDPENDTLTFEIASQPRRGTVVSVGDGTFIYTPRERFRGRDRFTYVAVDALGNVSAEATVRINVIRRTTGTDYADMGGNSAAFAAMFLAENGIFTGETLGGRHFFRPAKTVTRGEFLTMSLKISGIETLTGVIRTGFHDDADIPMWIKPYVSTALMSGVIRGYRNYHGNLVFSPYSPITFSEAAVILNNILDIPDVISVAAVQTKPGTPVWAYTAATNLKSTGVMPTGVTDIYNRHVTRADAAKMLLAAHTLLESGDGGSALLGWAR